MRLALLTALLIIAPAQAQSVDSLRGLREARAWTVTHQRPLLVATAILAISAQGNLAASHYATSAGNRYWIDIHGASEILGISHTALMYVGGLDPVEALGAAMIGQFVAQMAINAAFGLPLVNPDEARRYEVAGTDATWKRIFIGQMRWVQVGIGIVLILYRPILRFVRRAL
jgi:hypothetical protein